MEVSRIAQPQKSRSWLMWVLLALAIMWWQALSKKTPSGKPLSAAQITPVSQSSAQFSSAMANPLPQKIDREPMEPATRDPFLMYQPAPASVLLPKRSLAPVISVPPPMAQPMAVAAPSPPTMHLRFIGQMTTPEGGHLVYATLGEHTLLLTQGTVLSNGYYVSRIEPRQVLLTYPPLNYTTQFILPEPPRYETR